jgi:hypothetical protein
VAGRPARGLGLRRCRSCGLEGRGSAAAGRRARTKRVKVHDCSRTWSQVRPDDTRHVTPHCRVGPSVVKRSNRPVHCCPFRSRALVISGRLELFFGSKSNFGFILRTPRSRRKFGSSGLCIFVCRQCVRYVPRGCIRPLLGPETALSTSPDPHPADSVSPRLLS